MMRLSDVQKRAIRRGYTAWQGHRESGVSGDTMAALERRGLAEVRSVRDPYVRCIYRLTAAGDALRCSWARDDEPVERVPVAGVCDFCGAHWPDIACQGQRCGTCQTGGVYSSTVKENV